MQNLINQKIIKSLFGYLTILITILSFTGIAQWTIIKSGFNYDFENLMTLDIKSYLSLVGLVSLLILQFYFTYIVNIKIKNLGLNNWTRFSCLILSVLLSIPLYYFLNFDVPAFPFYLSIASFLFLADLFIDKRETSIIWIIFWMITLCSFSAILLFNNYLKFDQNKKLKFARTLINEKDPSFVDQLNAFDQLLDDKKVMQFLDSIPYPFKIHKVEFTQVISEILQDFESLDTKSKPIFNAYDKYNNSMVYDQFTTKAFYDEFKRNNIPVDQNIYFDPVTNIYVLKKSQIVKDHPDGPFSIYFEFLPNDKFDNPAKLLTHTYQKYHEEPDYGVYVNGILKETNGYHFNKNSDKDKNLKPEEYLVYNEKDIANLIYKFDNRTSIHLQSKFAKIIKPISLFSFLFILMGLMLSIIALINTKWQFLPDQFLIKLSNISSLRRRIQLSVIVLSILSFVAIGIVTIFYFRYLSEEYDNDLIREKNIAITADVSARLQNIEQERNALSKLETSIHDISSTHQIDIHLFKSDGTLINSSAPKLFELGFAPSILNQGLVNLLSENNGVYRNPNLEKIGDLSIINVFIPIKYSDHNENLAYIQLLHAPQIKTQNNVTDFVGTLLNVYVFLFLLAGAIALAVANSITRPIVVLGEQIKNFKLGRKNKKLEWDSEDELGELIRNYNNMAVQLDESAQLIAKTERDSAWREMAKQVAHEIKNPLTPMKLSIQYMQRAIDSSPNTIELVNRVSNTLIEQIDNLSQIASEFSNFGTMPQGNNQKIILNEIVETIHDLFRKRDDMDIFMTEPLDEIYVFADRNHLIRILNNIVKNAIQSIPTERKGRIDLKLYKKNGIAVIEVEDNGVGIAEEMKSKVFTPNFTTKSSGTGLGLAIAANMIESFNGKIKFTTIPEKGTRFYIEIPLMHIKDNFENVERVSLEIN